MHQLAIDGGNPVRPTLLPYATQSIDEADIQVVSDVLRSGMLTQGPWIERFESAVAEYVGATFAVSFSSGTAALHAACAVAGLQEGKRLLTTPMTFVASANCAFYVGARPDFVDIDASTYLIDPVQLEKNWTQDVQVVVPVDYTGQPVDMKLIQTIQAQRGGFVLQDAAHSLGAEDHGKKVGTLADMTMFSFHPVKHITSGEGGMIVTQSEEWVNALRDFRSHGITRDAMRLTRNDGPWYYEMQSLGFHYRMTDIQAALGASQLKKLDAFLLRRREIAQKYHEAFRELPGLTIPKQREGTNSAWHLYMLQWNSTSFKVSRKRIFEALRAENIGVHVHYIPVHLQPFYQQNGYDQVKMPVAESFYEQAMTIPLYPAMTDGDVQDVIDAIQKVHQHFWKSPNVT